MYQQPPDTSQFQPFIRPFRWYWTDISGLGRVRYPEFEDALLYNIGLDKTPTNKNASPDYFMSDVLSPYERLQQYQLFFNCIAPEDPNNGGLAGDSVDNDGNFTLNYYDYSDKNKVTRKKVIYFPKQNHRDVTQFNSQTNSFDNEGLDINRDLKDFETAMLRGFQVVASIALSIAAVNPAIGAAVAAFMQVGIDAIQNQNSVSTGRIIGSIVNLVQATGKEIDLSDVLSKQTWKDTFAANIYNQFSNTIQQNSILLNKGIDEVIKVTDYVSTLEKNVGDALGNYPLPTNDLVKNVTDIVNQKLDNIDSLVKNSSNLVYNQFGVQKLIPNEYYIALQAFYGTRNGDNNSFYSLRKICDQGIFDIAYSSYVKQEVSLKATLERIQSSTQLGLVTATIVSGPRKKTLDKTIFDLSKKYGLQL